MREGFLVSQSIVRPHDGAHETLSERRKLLVENFERLRVYPGSGRVERGAETQDFGPGEPVPMAWLNRTHAQD